MLENSCIMSGLCVEGPAPLQLAHFLSRHHHIQHDCRNWFLSCDWRVIITLTFSVVTTEAENVMAQMNLSPSFKVKAALNIEINLSSAYK